MALADTLAKLLGPKGWITKDTAAFQTDWLKTASFSPLGVARPSTTAEVAEIIRLAGAASVPVVPQGGNTSLCGGSVPAASGAVILSLGRLNKIAPVDADGFSVVAAAGAVLASVHEAAADQGLIFPMHLGSEGTAQIGGLIATNAGGSHALRYGMMQDLVLGLEVVLPDGRIWNGLRPVIKDNAGYQLRRLFCGSEGTLGVVTRAALRLYPAPAMRATALLAVPDHSALVRVGALARHAVGEVLSALEFFSDTGLELLLKHVASTSFPLQSRAPTYVLIDLGGSMGIDVAGLLERLVEDLFDADLVCDGTIAASEAQRAALWQLREEMPEGQRLEGPQIKHDVSVPTQTLADFLRRTEAELTAILPGVRINPFGHLADGNVHYNLTPPPGATDFAGQNAILSHRIYALAEDMGGSFAAEHGLGRSKLAFADTLRSMVERDLMRRVKLALDPENLLNPGVIVSAGDPQE